MKSPLKTAAVTLATIGMLSATAASAATLSGHISRLDAKSHTLRLGHRLFHVSPRLQMSAFHKGEHVRLSYHSEHGKRWVTAYKPITGKVASLHAMHAKKKSS